MRVGDFVVPSDGSSELVRRDPQTLEPRAVLYVRCAGQRVQGLNDLAWSAGTIWANVAGTHYLAGIDPDSGEVTDVVNARKAGERREPDMVTAICSRYLSDASQGSTTAALDGVHSARS